MNSNKGSSKSSGVYTRPKAYRIKFKEEDKVKGFYILMTNAFPPVTAYDDDTYVVTERHLEILNSAGVSYEILNRR
jgi:hypothetical protein